MLWDSDSIMVFHCKLCGKQFNRRFNRDRHVETIHKQKKSEDVDDVRAEEESPEEESTEETEEVDSEIEGEESDPEIEGEEGDPETENDKEQPVDEDEEDSDFWGFIISETVLKEMADRQSGEEPLLSEYRDPEALLENKEYLDLLVEALRIRYEHLSDGIENKGGEDKLLNLIIQKKEKVADKFKGSDDDDDESVDDEASETAWKAFKPMVKKRLKENLDTLKDLYETVA